MNKKGSFNMKASILALSTVAFLTGFLLIDRGGLSGNAIVTSEPSIGAVSIVGLLLIVGAVTLAAYGIKR